MSNENTKLLDENTVQLEGGGDLQKTTEISEIAGGIQERAEENIDTINSPKVVFEENRAIAKEPISRGEVITVFDGQIIDMEAYQEKAESIVPDNVLQVGKTSYRVLEASRLGKIRHSCEPNCGISRGDRLVAIAEIKDGEELTWDRATSRNGGKVEKCDCGSEHCRGKIDFSATKLEDRQKYAKEGMVMPWILEDWKKESKFTTETRYNADISEEYLQELSRTVLETYTNFSTEYVFCPDCDPEKLRGQRMSARQVYGITEKGGYVPSDELINNPQIPQCDCGEDMKLFHTFEGTLGNISEKIDKYPFWAVTMVNETGEIVGFVYGYEPTLQKGFEENWGKYYTYTHEADIPDTTRPFDNFQKLISEKFAENLPEVQLGEDGLLDPEHRVLLINIIAVNPKYRDAGNFYKLGAGMYFAIPKASLLNPIIFETTYGSVAYHGFVDGVGSIPVHGVLTPIEEELQKGDSIICVQTGEKIGSAYASQAGGKKGKNSV